MTAMIQGIVHDHQAVRLSIREQLVGKPLLKILCSHLIMIVCIFLVQNMSNVGKPTTLSACCKNDQPCTFTTGLPVKKKTVTKGLSQARTYLTPPSVPPVTMSLPP